MQDDSRIYGENDMTKNEAALSSLAEIENIKSQFEDYRHKANFERDYLRQVAEQAEAKAKQYRSECVTTMDKLEAAEARAAELITTVKCQREYIEALESDVRLLFPQRNALRAALEAVQWVGDVDRVYYCPWCAEEKRTGHAPKCKRQAALGGEGENKMTKNENDNDPLRGLPVNRPCTVRDQAPEICGVICNCGPNGEPIACGFLPDHEGAHSWATLLTFAATPRADAEAQERGNDEKEN